MPTYSKVQFVAFNIGPGTDAGGVKEKYLGDTHAGKDMMTRVDVMKEAIRTAYDMVRQARLDESSGATRAARSVAQSVTDSLRSANNSIARGVANAIDSSSALKIFMAPEFYFRGADGAYPISTVAEIIREMRSETDQDKYRDWLFVFGTAVGYQKGDETQPFTLQKRDQLLLQIEAVDATGPKPVVTVDGLPHGDWLNAKVDRVYAKASAMDVTHSDDLAHALILLNQKLTVPNGSKAWFEDILTPNSMSAFAVVSSDLDPNTGDTRLKVAYAPDPDCPLCPCTAFVANPPRNKHCKTCGHAHLDIFVGDVEVDRATKLKVTEVQPLGGRKYKLTLDTNAVIAKDEYIEIKQAKTKEVTEVLNVALVRKGGKEGTGLREAVVYKEYVSSIDYIAPLHGEQDFYDLSEGGLVIEIHGEYRMVKATEGSRDVQPNLGSAPNLSGATIDVVDRQGVHTKKRISEINKSGLGGGSVFTIDGITFGLEVCLDHGQNRLDEYYRKYRCDACGAQQDTAGACAKCADPGPVTRLAAVGDPRVQVLLIPSWGMTIGDGAIGCLPRGLIFNVDGGRAGRDNASVARVYDGKFGCDDHLAQISDTKKPCPTLHAVYYCKACYGGNKEVYFKAGPCPHCNVKLTAQPENPPNPDLKRSGTPLQPIAGPKPVSMGACKPNWQKYFATAGSIMVYPEAPIPAARQVT